MSRGVIAAVVCACVFVRADVSMSANPKPNARDAIVSKSVYQIEASDCVLRGPDDVYVLTGFYAKELGGIVTASHGVVGCRSVYVTPVLASSTSSGDYVDVSRTDIDHDLALLTFRHPPASPPPGLSISKHSSSSDFLVCGYPQWISKYACGPTSMNLASPQTLEALLTTVSTTYNEFVARKSPLVSDEVYLMTNPELFGEGDSGAPVIDLTDDSVVAIVDGAIERTSGATKVINPFAMPLDHVSWTDARSRTGQTVIARVASLARPSALTSAKLTALPAMPMTPEQADLWRRTVTSFAQGLLDTNLCEWMYIGSDILNHICGSKPCEAIDIAVLYGILGDPKKTIGKFSSTELDTVCKSIAGSMPLITQTGGTLKCDQRLMPFWLDRYSDLTFAEMLRPEGLGGGAQPALLRNIGWYQVPQDQRDAVVDAMLAKWAATKVGNPTALATAETLYQQLQTACGAAGCQLGEGVLTTRTWSQMRASLFDSWLDYFSATPPAWVRGGCDNARMRHDAPGDWHVEVGTSDCHGLGPDKCLSFGQPRRTELAAKRFFDSLPFVSAQPKASISIVPASVPVGGTVKLTVDLAGGALIPSGSSVRVDVPPCFTITGVSPTADVDGNVYMWPIGSNAISPGSSYVLDLVANGCTPGVQTVNATVETAHSTQATRLAGDVTIQAAR